jgi:dihydroorotate dehydrogenase (NAD+) catalytic subunit
MMDLSVNLCGKTLKNPLILASGILGTKGAVLKRVAEQGAGAIVTKSIGLYPREGYKNPTVLKISEDIVLNAMGLPNPGCDEFLKEIKIAKEGGVPVIVSIFGGSKEEFAHAASVMQKAGADILELNFSCLHSFPSSHSRKDDFSSSNHRKDGVYCFLSDYERLYVGQDKERTKEVVQEVKKNVDIPIMVKLSPNVTSIVEIANACIEGGADALSLVNTFKALEIEPMVETPVLGNHLGGQSGPSIRCMAQRLVADVLVAMETEKIKTVPVVGVGGIESGDDVARFLLLGCRCVQIGSAVLKHGFDVFTKCSDELQSYMRKKGYNELDDFRGNALKWLVNYGK